MQGRSLKVTKTRHRSSQSNLKKKHVSQYRKLQEIKQESKPDSKTISNRPHLRNRLRKAVN